MKKYLLLLTSFFTAAAFASEVRPDKFPFCKTVGIPADRSDILLIPIDEEIYRHTEPGQEDLRIVSPSGEQVPYVVSPLFSGWETRYADTIVKGKIVGFELDKQANAATIEYELNEAEHPVEMLRLVTSDRDFDKSVSLEFDDGTATEKFPFFNRSKNVKFQNDTFRFSPKKAKRIKIHVHNFAEKRTGATLEHIGKQDTFTESKLFTGELRLDEIRFFVKTGTVSPKKIWQDLPLPELSREKKGKTTEIRLDAGRRNIKTLLFRTSTPEYTREVGVRAVRRRGDTVSEHRFGGKIEPQRHELPVPDFRADEYIVTIQNGDDPELADLSVSANIEEEALLLEGSATPAGTLKILYGSGDTGIPQYGLRKYVAKLYGKNWKVATASPETANPEFRKEADPGSFFKQAIGWILAAAVLLLAVLAWKSFSRITPEKE